MVMARRPCYRGVASGARRVSTPIRPSGSAGGMNRLGDAGPRVGYIHTFIRSTPPSTEMGYARI